MDMGSKRNTRNLSQALRTAPLPSAIHVAAGRQITAAATNVGTNELAALPGKVVCYANHVINTHAAALAWPRRLIGSLLVFVGTRTCWIGFQGRIGERMRCDGDGAGLGAAFFSGQGSSFTN
jgi:hypothetical protein